MCAPSRFWPSAKGSRRRALHAALALGLTQFGENYLDEALGKISALAGTAAEWHFIGRLQGNKTRPVAEHFSWVHGVDRERIARRLSEQRSARAAPLNVCVQVNIAGEASKSGVSRRRGAAPAARHRGRCHDCACGASCACCLSTCPRPNSTVTSRALRGLLETANAQGLGLDTLSMGMSDDLEAAVAEGATIVRIGTALFGPRPQ